MNAMSETAKERVEGFGFLLRFILPIMVFLGGWLVTDKLDSIVDSQNSLQQQLFDVKVDTNAVKLELESLKGVTEDIHRNERNIEENRKRLRKLENSSN